MSHFAQVIDGLVVRVLVIEQDVVDSGHFGDPSTWVQTSYNTRGGVYYTPNTNDADPDQSKAFRKNFAGIGYTWDADRDAFIPQQPFPSWVLDEFSCLWNPPIPYPSDNKLYIWNELIKNWTEVPSA